MGLLKFLCKEDIKTKLFSVGHLSMMPSLLNVSPLRDSTTEERENVTDRAGCDVKKDRIKVEKEDVTDDETSR